MPPPHRLPTPPPTHPSVRLPCKFARFFRVGESVPGVMARGGAGLAGFDNGGRLVLVMAARWSGAEGQRRGSLYLAVDGGRVVIGRRVVVEWSSVMVAAPGYVRIQNLDRRRPLACARCGQVTS